MTTPERRQTPRTRLRDLIYVDLGPDNGGIVLDVSQGGLAFHSVAPIQQTSAINFSLLVMGRGRFDVSGELAWTDEKRTTCGLKFTSLPASSRAPFQNWTVSSQASPVDLGSASSPVPQPLESAAPVPRAPEPAGRPTPELSTVAERLPFEPVVEAQRKTPLFRKLLLGVSFAALLAMAFEYGRRVGESQNNVQRLPIASPPQVPQAKLREPEAVSVPVPVSATPGVAPVDVPNAEAIPGKTPATLRAESRTRGATDPQADPNVDDGQTELTAALGYLNGTNGERRSSAAVRLLWTAVAKGNAAAEVILAGLYIRGDGVAKSCEQGRVLLAAASKKGNAEAGKKLEDLKTNGCR